MHTHQWYLAPCWQFGLSIRLLVIAFKLAGAPPVVCIQRSAVSLNVFIYHIWQDTRKMSCIGICTQRFKSVTVTTTDLHQGSGGPHLEHHHRSPLHPSVAQFQPHLQLAKEKTGIKIHILKCKWKIVVPLLFPHISVRTILDHSVPPKKNTEMLCLAKQNGQK